MTDNHTQLEMRWIPVTGDNGRTRMEAVWIVPTESAGITQAA